MTGLAAQFALIARGEEPIDNGAACCVCGNSEGELEQIGYDEVLGELWIHKTGNCKNRVRQAVKNSQREYEQRMSSGLWRP